MGCVLIFLVKFGKEEVKRDFFAHHGTKMYGCQAAGGIASWWGKADRSSTPTGHSDRISWSVAYGYRESTCISSWLVRSAQNNLNGLM
jgi:hypothetical protein